MDAELKAKWVEALRSGEYEQCRGRLTDGKGFCCFGVLVKLQNGNLSDEMQYDDLAKQISRGEKYYEQKIRLVKMNDDGASFSEIADYIEANL